MDNVNKIKRWNETEMLNIGHRLFAKIYKKKRIKNHNHELHFLARDLDRWLPEGVKALINGSYVPRHLKRYYFIDEMVDQLYPADRIFQHILLKQIKPTLTHVVNPNCLHIFGPSGVKRATERIRKILETENPRFIIRADIKSFYKSICHFKLLNDLKTMYDDPKLLKMFEEIIKNPTETPRGYKNADTGIALRGPLSQLFSAIYLKSVDDAFNHMDVTYIRYQDDLIILCKTKRQLNRARRKLMESLHERRLKLSRKKSRIGSIEKGFHFFRKAREQIKIMVTTGFSAHRIRLYLQRWATWWARTSKIWSVKSLLVRFMQTCHDGRIAAFASALLFNDKPTLLSTSEDEPVVAVLR